MGVGEHLPIDCLSELKVHFYLFIYFLAPQTEQLPEALQMHLALFAVLPTRIQKNFIALFSLK